MASGRRSGRRHERPVEALRSIGIEPEDVDHVIVTPLMAYSAANLSAFPNAVYTISRKGWISRLAPEYGWVKVRGGDKPPLAQYRSPLDIYIPPEQFHYLIYEAYNRLNLIDEGELEPGLSVWWAGVHHRGSLSVEIESDAGTVLTSDAYFYYENVENDHYLGVGESFARRWPATSGLARWQITSSRSTIPRSWIDIRGQDRWPGSEGGRMTDRPVRVTVLGAGSWTCVNHLPQLERRPDVELIAAVDTFDDRRQHVRDRFGFQLVTDDVEEALALEADAVIVGSTPDAHYGLVKAALEAGATSFARSLFARAPNRRGSWSSWQENATSSC